MADRRIPWEYTDIHCHVLPGVDDGSRSMGQTLEMLRIAESEGFRNIIATPHYREGRFQTSGEKIRLKLQEVRRCAAEAGIRVNLYAGREIFYSGALEEHLESLEVGPLNASDYLLIEFSPFEDFKYLRNALENVLGLGFTPILAHAERYQCLVKRWENVEQLRGMGCEIQVNGDSIVGGNGYKVRRFVHRLLKKGLVDYVGTDAHDEKDRSPRIRKCAALLCKKYGEEYAGELLNDNAVQRLIRKN